MYAHPLRVRSRQALALSLLAFSCGRETSDIAGTPSGAGGAPGALTTSSASSGVNLPGVAQPSLSVSGAASSGAGTGSAGSAGNAAGGAGPLATSSGAAGGSPATEEEDPEEGAGGSSAAGGAAGMGGNSAGESTGGSDNGAAGALNPSSGIDAGSSDGSAALDSLDEYLSQPHDARAPIAEQAFAQVPLTSEQAQLARERLWQDHVANIESTRAAEHAAREITQGDLRLRYDFTIFGDAPAAGRSLFISLHGGGNAEPSVNDSQWENQKQLYQPDEGIYLSPRAPTDTWNLWHEAHIDPMFERLIENLIVLEGVNPDRVYVMGYSAGGDGVYQLGPRMADHWAAASAMAGHPNEAQPYSLRNIGFTIHVGELDTAYDRNLVAGQWDEQLNELAAADPEGYRHEVTVHAGKPHWMDLEDAVAVPWMAEFTRDPLPQQIVWYQDDITHDRFYWLAVEAGQAQGETTVRASLEGQRISVQSEDVPALTLRLNDEMLNLDLPVSIEVGGAEVWSGIVPRSIAVLAQTLEERGDPRLVFCGQVQVEL